MLIVGAGPTGLTLAVELLRAGVSFRIVDAAATPVHESRALAIQARTLEVLEPAGIAGELVRQGDPAREIVLHARRDVAVPLFDQMNRETVYPFILFLSQAETERVLLEHLQRHGVTVDRGARVLSLRQHEDAVQVELQTAQGLSTIGIPYVVGCDGAHSVVRSAAGIDFAGTGFPQSFALADLEVDGLSVGPVHSFISEAGIMFFFPLGGPATWRLLVMLPDAGQRAAPQLAELQALVDSFTTGIGSAGLRLRDPVWITEFRVQSRRAVQFRKSRVFLAGDAAHIHSPAGAQGMNTGIQDAVNLAWKLAQVLQGSASRDLLDTYEQERLPVARRVLSMTDRLFSIATSKNRLIGWLRPRLAPVVLSVAVRFKAARRLAFRTVAEINLNYRRGPLAATSGHGRWRGYRAGDRVPDVLVNVGGDAVMLRHLLRSPQYVLVAIDHPEGQVDGWRRIVAVQQASSLGRSSRPMWMLIRPDGYIGGIWHTAAQVDHYLELWSAEQR